MEQELLTEFKNRMHISHSAEDANLLMIIKASVDDIKHKCSLATLEDNNRAIELVLERSRYVYNDSVEFFDENFRSQLTSVGLESVLGGFADETKV